MLKKIFLFLLLFIFISSAASAAKKDDEKPQCTVLNQKEYCQLENGKPYSGKREEYYADGKLKSIENYKDGYRHGLVTLFDEEGKLQERLYYKNGVKNGMDKLYYNNRTIKYLLNYKDGVLDGRMDVYTETGDLKGRLNYRRGVLEDGFCIDEKGKKVKMTSAEKAAYYNSIYGCGVK